MKPTGSLPGSQFYCIYTPLELPEEGMCPFETAPFVTSALRKGPKQPFRPRKKTCIFSQMLLWSFVCLCFLLTFPNSKQNMAWKQSFMGYSGKGTRSEDLLIETPVLQSSGWYIYGKERKDSLGTREVPILEKKNHTKGGEGENTEHWLNQCYVDKHVPRVAFTGKFKESFSIHVGWETWAKEEKWFLN